MSNKKKAPTKNSPSRPTGTQRPEGFGSISDDLDGFWDPESGPILVRPLYAKLSDSKLDSLKTSTLIFCDLVDASPLIDRDKDVIKGEPGDLVGIWGKPGMSAIRECCGVVTYLELTGEVDTGKKNPMKTFEVSTKDKKKGTRILIKQDNRRDSSQLSFLEDTPERRDKSSAGRSNQNTSDAPIS